MACVFWQDECETKVEELMKKIKYCKNVKMKMDIKEEVLSEKFQD
jgi:hypothetical protein